jgi:hypothetical protein
MTQRDGSEFSESVSHTLMPLEKADESPLQSKSMSRSSFLDSSTSKEETFQSSEEEEEEIIKRIKVKSTPLTSAEQSTIRHIAEKHW